MSLSFEQLANTELAEAIKKQNIINPSPIQEACIPLLIEGKDILACSQTGSGKTLAYLLPLFMKMNQEIKNPQAIVVAPTHELAVQIYKQAELLAKNSSNYVWVNPTLLIGGANINRQLDKLKEKPRLIVGSSGRLLELIKIKKLSVHFVKTIVIDEADRLLTGESLPDIQTLVKATLRDRQIALFSASFSEALYPVANSLMKEYQTVNLAKGGQLPESIRHIYFKCEYRDKIKYLRKIVYSERIKKAVVFVSNPSSQNIGVITERLNFHGIKSGALFGETKKHERRQVLQAFREGRITLLIASDLAARGLDFESLSHVINYDMPEDTDLFLHRIGRCGRMGKEGMGISLVTDRETVFVRDMEKAFDIHIELKTISFGKIIDTSEKIKKGHKPKEANENGRRKQKLQ